MSDLNDTEYTYEPVPRQPALPPDYYMGLCRKLEGRIAELEAQLARTWQPVPDGYIEGDMSMWGLMVYGNMLVIGNGTGGNAFLLPDGKRLCILADAAGIAHECDRLVLAPNALRGQVAGWEDVPEGDYPDTGGETMNISVVDGRVVLSLDSFDPRFGTSWLLPLNWRLQRRKEGD